MQISRRDTLLMGLGAAVAAAIPVRAAANADAAIEAFTGGAQAGAEGITLIAPEIAENGNNVPVSVEAPGAEVITIFTTANPEATVGTFSFGPLSGVQLASTRIRLAETQDVIAIAKMADGSFLRASQEVKVTIGGCGG